LYQDKIFTHSNNAMSDLNNLKTKNELLAELDTAKASYDSAKIGELEAQIKKIEEQ